MTPRSASAPPAGATGVDLSAPTSGVSPGLKFGILAATGLMPLVGIGMGLYFWRQRDNPEKVAVGKLWFSTGLGLMVLYTLLANT